jgi:hypothetical protein
LSGFVNGYVSGGIRRLGARERESLLAGIGWTRNGGAQLKRD